MPLDDALDGDGLDGERLFVAHWRDERMFVPLPPPRRML